METISLLTAFFGWCLLINIGLLLVAFLFVVLLRDFTGNIHTKLFNLPKSELDRVYFKYLAYYKIGILLFNLAPYVALKLIA